MSPRPGRSPQPGGSTQPGDGTQPGGGRRMVRWTLALYPRAWRARYGGEVASLSEELIAEGDSTPWRAGLDLIAGAAVERGRALARSRRIAVVPAVAVLVATAGTGWALTRPHPYSHAPQAASLASIHCVIPPFAVTRGGKVVRGRSGSSVLIPARPGSKPGRAGAAGQVRLKPGRCIALPGPCAIGPVGPSRLRAGAGARIQPVPAGPPTRIRAVPAGPPGRIQAVPGPLPAVPARLRPVPARLRPGQIRLSPVPGWVTSPPGRCIVLPPRCVRRIVLPRGTARASGPPGPGWIPAPSGAGWIPAPPLRRAAGRHQATVAPATLRPVPGWAKIRAGACVMAAGVT
jgi:hypothetical protein